MISTYLYDWLNLPAKITLMEIMLHRMSKSKIPTDPYDRLDTKMKIISMELNRIKSHRMSQIFNQRGDRHRRGVVGRMEWWRDVRMMCSGFWRRVAPEMTVVVIVTSYQDTEGVAV